MPGAGFYPFHRRAVQFFRGQAGQGQVRVIADLVAETAADIVGAQADLVHADAQRRRKERQRHGHDGVGEQVNLAALVPGGDAGVGFDGGAAKTVEIQLADFDHVGRVRERLVHVAVFIHAREDRIGAGLVVQHGLVRQGVLGVQHHVQGFVFHVDKLGGVLGNGNGFGDHGNHRVALVDGLVRGQGVVGDLLRRACAYLDERVAHFHDFIAGKGAGHAGQGLRPGDVDADDAGVGIRRAHQGHVQQAGGAVVINEEPLALDQAVILPARGSRVRVRCVEQRVDACPRRLRLFGQRGCALRFDPRRGAAVVGAGQSMQDAAEPASGLCGRRRRGLG